MEAANTTTPSTRITPDEIRSRKGGAPIVTLTAYTYPIARLLDPHCELLLVGDSVAMVLHGHKNTLGATVEMMILHGQAVMRGSQRPASSSTCRPAATRHPSNRPWRRRGVSMPRPAARRSSSKAASMWPRQIAAIVAAGIPVMGHIGLQPQSVEKEGGYKIKGKSDDNVAALYRDAEAVEKAGAFALVIEGTIEDVAAGITKAHCAFRPSASAQVRPATARFSSPTTRLASPSIACRNSSRNMPSCATSFRRPSRPTPKRFEAEPFPDRGTCFPQQGRSLMTKPQVVKSVAELRARCPQMEARWAFGRDGADHGRAA